jgi:hypothetical protein
MKTSEGKQLKPFAWAGGAWLVLGTVGIAALASPEARMASIGWFLLFWILGVADLATIVGLVFSMVTSQNTRDKARIGFRIAVLAIAKVALLLIFGAILFLRDGIPQSSLLVGLATLIVVPLLGGLAWIFQGKVSPE